MKPALCAVVQQENPTLSSAVRLASLDWSEAYREGHIREQLVKLSVAEAVVAKIVSLEQVSVGDIWGVFFIPRAASTSYTRSGISSE